MPDFSGKHKMENTTALLWRQEDALAERQVFVVEADDANLASLPHQSMYLHSDLATIEADQYGPWPQVPSMADLVVVILPKSRERLDLVLTALSQSIENPIELWLVGPSKGGIKGALKQLQNFADGGHVDLLDTARHCRVYTAMLAPQVGKNLQDFAQQWRIGDATYVSYPGVFSHGRMDEGTALLLEQLPQSFVGNTALDMGCGAGVIALELARRHAEVTASDVSATAAAATAATLAENQQEGLVRVADLYGDLAKRFNYIVTNPPFHDGITRTTAVTEALIKEAPKYLTENGELWLVANHGLAYEPLLQQVFRQVKVVATTSRFVVWQAQEPVV